MPLLVPAGASKVVGMDGDFGEMRPFSGSEETCLDGGKMLHHVTSCFQHLGVFCAESQVEWKPLPTSAQYGIDMAASA